MATLSEPPPIINIQQQVPSFSSTSHSDSVMWVAAAAAAASASATALPQPTASLQQFGDDGSSMGPGAVESATAYNLFSGGHTFWNNQQSADRFGSLVPPGDSAPATTTQTAHSVVPLSHPNPTRLAHFMSLHVDDSSSSWMHQQDPDSGNHQHHPQHGVIPTHQLQRQQVNSPDAVVYRNLHKLLYPAGQAPSSVGTGAAPLSPAAYPAPHYHSNHQPRRHSFGVMTSDGSPVGGVPGHSRRTPPSRSAQSMEEVESILGAGRRACDSSAASSMKWKPKKPPKYKGRFYPVIGGREGSCLYKKKKHAIKQTKGLPNSAMKAFNLYEKAKGWLDEQLDVDIEWMTKKELARYTRVSTGNAAVSGGDSGGESDSDDEGPDASVLQDKIEKVFTVVQSRTGKPVIVCTRYALLGAESSDGAESTIIVLGSFMSYRSADAFVRPNAYAASAHAPKHANSIRGPMMMRERGGYQQTSFRQGQHYPLQEQPVHQHWGRQQQQQHHQRHYSSQTGYTGEMEKVSDGWLQQQSWGMSMGDNKHHLSSPSMPPPPVPPPSRPSARPYNLRQAEQPQRGGLYGAPGGHRSLTPLAPASAVNSGTNGIMQSGRWDQARRSSSSDDDVTDGQLYSRSAHIEAAPHCFHSHQYGQYSTDGDGHFEGAMSESHPDYIAGMLKDLWDTGPSEVGSSMADTWNVNHFHY